MFLMKALLYLLVAKALPIDVLKYRKFHIMKSALSTPQAPCHL